MTFLYEALSISLMCRENISFIGAGGKTTAMFHLAGELKALGKRVLVTTTTSIYYPEEDSVDNIIIGFDIEELTLNKEERGNVTVWGTEVTREGKLKGAGKEGVDRIFYSEKFDYIINEADGSKRKPLKAPADYEPVVPESTTKVVGIIGLDAIGKNIREVVHRPELFCQITGLKDDEKVDINSVCKILFHENGLFRNTPEAAEKTLLVNKVDDDKSKLQGEMLRKLIMDEKDKRRKLLNKVYLTSLLNGRILSE